MVATKTNERPGVRAQVRYLRVSAYKAREVLNLIRGLSVAQAREVLELTERDVADEVLKCLNSAIANAIHNNDIPEEELLVGAAYADEGPTLKRFRPRARGRATSIRKRTTHITIIVSRMTQEELAIAKARQEKRLGGARTKSADRSRRVARSRGDNKSASTEPETTDEHNEEITTPVTEENTVAETVVEEKPENAEAAANEIEESAETTGEDDAVESATDEISEGEK